MPDIAMCPDVQCPAADVCRRNPRSGTVPDPLIQAWALFERKPEEPACSEFIERERR